MRHSSHTSAKWPEATSAQKTSFLSERRRPIGTRYVARSSIVVAPPNGELGYDVPRHFLPLAVLRPNRRTPLPRELEANIAGHGLILAGPSQTQGRRFHAVIVARLRAFSPTSNQGPTHV